VPSTISSRMNSASEAKMWNTSRPPAVVVSSASYTESEADISAAELADHGEQVFERTGQPVQAGYDQYVAWAQVLEARGQLRPLRVPA
jgi:hypothetical protein